MINKMLRLSFFPLIFRLMALAVFVLLVINGLSATSEDAVFLKILRNTNLANLIVWSYWWPLIIVAAVIFGRLWCFVCPVEMLTSFFAKIGLKKKRAGWLESGWGITLFYIIILFVGIQGLAVHRDPSRMAWYLIAIAGVSVISGLIFEKNTFCASICPIGHLLGLYARISPWGWRVKEPAICGSCKDKSCVHKDYTYNSISKSCGVYLLPEKLDDNTACILCSGCMKACNKYNPEKVEGRPNPGFRYIGFAKDLFKNKTLSMAETFFVLIVSGFVIYEILSEWSGTKQILMFLPKLLKNYFDIHSPVVFGLEKSTILF
ncbi:MAG: 4Fe-4S binding protein [bacterium]|nr:4Fe-4S binding protein [bacterium]